jgi:hypothetical protein
MPQVVRGFESAEKRVLATVLREAMTGGSMQKAMDLYGTHLSAGQRDALAQLSDSDIARFRDIAATIPEIPGDKAA